jgi:hypothetical protein
MCLFPARDEALDVAPLGIGERHLLDEPSRFRRIVVGDGGFEVLAKRRRLAQLPSKPPEKAYSRLALHANRRLHR